MWDLKLDQLHTFTEVIEYGSFSAAADRLHLSQPAVSLQIRQLEKRLGVRLIERVGKRATPTAAGQELLTHVSRIEAAVSAAVERMASHATGDLGRVRIGTGATVLVHLLPPILRDLKGRFSTLDISIRIGTTPELLRAVDENAIDVALLTLPAAGRMFDVTPVCEDGFVAATPAGADSWPAVVTPAVMAAHAVLFYEADSNTRRIVDGWFAAAGVTLRPVLDAGSVEAIKELVGAGLGASILPEMAMRTLDEGSGVVTRPLKPALKRTLGIVVRSDKILTRGLREAIKGLQSIA